MNLGGALNIIKRHQVRMPVHLAPILRALKIQLMSLSPEADANISCITKKTSGRNNFVVYIHPSHSYGRRRFSVAHALAHIILHGDLFKKKRTQPIIDDIFYMSDLPIAHEDEANRLALDILMPMEHVVEALKDEFLDIDGLAALFKVSPSTAGLRLGIPIEV